MLLRDIPDGSRFQFADTADEPHVYTARGNGWYQFRPYDGGPWFDPDRPVCDAPIADPSQQLSCFA